MLPHQEFGDLESEGTHFFQGAGPIGIAAGIAQIDKMLTGNQVHQCPHHGQPPEAAVEDSDRPRIHPYRLGVAPPTPDRTPALPVLGNLREKQALPPQEANSNSMAVGSQKARSEAIFPSSVTR